MAEIWLLLLIPVSGLLTPVYLATGLLFHLSLALSLIRKVYRNLDQAL